MNNLWAKSTIEIILILIILASLLTGLGYLFYLFLLKTNIKKIRKGNKEIIIDIGDEETKKPYNYDKVFSNIINSVIDTVTNIIKITQIDIVSSQMAYVSNNIEYVIKKLQNFFFEYLDENKLWEDDLKSAIYSKIESETEITAERIVLKGIRDILKTNHIPNAIRNKDEFTRYINNVYTSISVPIRSYLKDKNDHLLDRTELDTILEKWNPVLYNGLENIFIECKNKYDKKLDKAKKLELNLIENIKSLSDVKMQTIISE